MSKEFVNLSDMTTYNGLIQGWINGNHVELTQAEYNALSTAEKNNGAEYFITDGAGGGQFTASDITFRNAGTDMTSTNCQSAIVELNNKINAVLAMM